MGIWIAGARSPVCMSKIRSGARDERNCALLSGLPNQSRFGQQRTGFLITACGDIGQQGPKSALSYRCLNHLTDAGIEEGKRAVALDPASLETNTFLGGDLDYDTATMKREAASRHGRHGAQLLSPMPSRPKARPLYSSETEDAMRSSRGAERKPAPKRSRKRPPNTLGHVVAIPIRGLPNADTR